MEGLLFNSDGTVDPESLAGMPEELVARVQTPEFKAQAAAAIAQAKRKAQFEHDAKVIRSLADQQHEQRRPSGVSGRQRKRLRKLARIAASAIRS